MKKYFITGLIILLPLAMTIAIVAFIVNFLTQPFMGLVSKFLSEFNIAATGIFIFSADQVIRYSSQLIILISLMLITIILGMIARWFFFKSLLSLSDKILHRIPVVNKVYKTSQEIIKTLFSSDKNSFKQVVLVPFPNEGSYAIGLIARESPKECCDKIGEQMTSVLIPTTPNPTTGYLLMYKNSQIINLKMRPEEAIKYVVSCGVIIPQEA